jgi:hypothetical protein
MAASSKQSAITALLEYYRIKYPVKAERIEALKADYLAAYEAKSGQVGKTLSGSGADGVNATWLVSLSTEEQLAVLASALRRLEGRASTSAILFARERYENETLRTN